MARATFAGTAGDFLATISNGGLVRAIPGSLTIWSAKTGGTQLTDLLLDGSPVSSIPVGADGQVPQFQGPDGVSDVWADAGGGSRVRLVPDIVGVLTGEDTAVSALVNAPASDTRAALNGQIVQGADARLAADAANPASVIVQRSGLTSFHDDFTTKPDGALTAGAISDSGHVYTVLGQIPWAISDGALTHTQTNPASSQSSYLGVNLGDEVGYIWADYEVPAGGDPQEYITLIASAEEFTGAPAYEFANAAAHCTFTDDDFRYDVLEATHPGLVTTILGRGQYPALAPGVYRVEVALDGSTATVTAPDGRRWKPDQSALIASRNGPWATLQLYALGDGTRKALRVLRWGAEVQPRNKRGPYASPLDVARAATVPGRVLGAMQTTGANVATAITTSLSARLFGLTVPIPPSRRVLIEGQAWFDEQVPTTPTTTALMIGVYPGGVSTHGKLTTVVSGYTPASNNGGTSAYATGRLLPFSLILDLDPAFEIGSAHEFQVKAQGSAAGQFTFIDSGSASGGTATLRRSTLKITELAPA